jgi:hypothetical protein
VIWHEVLAEIRPTLADGMNVAVEVGELLHHLVAAADGEMDEVFGLDG